MTLFTTTVWPIVLWITRAGSQPSTSGPAERFTGSVRIDYLFQPSEPSARRAHASRSSPALGRHGTRTRWARP